MDIKGEFKIIGDNYEGFYSAGMTMLGSETATRLNKVYEDELKTLYEDDRGLRLICSHRILPDTGAVALETTIENNSENKITLEFLTSFMLTDIKADKIHRIQSFWSSEGRVQTQNITDLNLEYSWGHFAYRVEKFGNIGSMPVRKYFPFIILEDSENQDFTAVQLYIPSSWQIEIMTRKDELLTVAGGIADRDFGHWTKVVNQGDSFTSPKAVVATGKSLLEVCDKLVKSQKPKISPVDSDMGIVFNEYCTTWGNPSEENLIKICDRIKGKGIKYLVMDAGWYGNEGNWWDYIGQWDVNKAKFPNGLKPVTKYIKDSGMIPGIWFEFEPVTKGCSLYSKPEYLLKKDGIPLTVGDRRFLDMENPKVIEHLKRSVIGLLKDNEYGYVKTDYNDTIGIGCDNDINSKDGDGLGENLRRKIKATQSFFKLMTNEIDDLVIELCSAGGHRLEPSMLELVSQASFSDAHETTAIPIIAANLHRVMRPEQSQIWAVIRENDSDNRIYYLMCATLLGRMGLSGDIYDLDEHQWSLVDEGIAYYKKVSDIIKNGTTVVIDTDTNSYNNPTGGQVVIRELGNLKLLVYHRFESSISLSEFLNKQGIDCNLSKVVSRYGEAKEDFSSESLLLELD